MSPRLAIALAAVFLGAPGCSGGPPQQRECQEDSQCASGEICFPDGCGDPGTNLVVEVTANTRSGQHEQDFAIADGSLRPTYDVELLPPMSITGQVDRSTTADGNPDWNVLYSEPFTIRATGESVIIPGVSRTFEQSYPRPERGAFSMPVGAGRYTVTAIAADATIPPMVRTAVKVDNGVNSQLYFAFPSIDGTLDITGRLIQSIEPGVPPVEIPLDQAAMELEAIDPATRRPISQRTYTATGITGSSRGDFVLTVDPAAKLLPSFQIIARPRDSAAIVPTKTFTLTKPYPVGTTVLQVGDFGTVLTGLTGQVVDGEGAPVGYASVFLEGKVSGGGTFKSRTVLTNALGEFSVDVLPSADDGAYTITVLPLSRSSAGVLTATTRAVPKPGYKPVLEPARFTCPDRLKVTGTLLRPDGKGEAAAVEVIATPIKAADGRPLPLEPFSGVTDENGRFTFHLDPAVYRFDFQPGEEVPRMSRYIPVRNPEGPDASGVSGTIELGELSLSKGRKVTGKITARLSSNSAETPVAASNATVRVFRLATIDGKPGAVLLGEAVADAFGNYGVVLPGTPPSTAP